MKGSIYEYVSEDVHHYWHETERYLADVVKHSTLSPESLKALNAAQVNLRLLVSQVNFEKGVEIMNKEQQ